MIRWGILGPGKIARKFCDDLTMSADALITAVASRDIDRAKAFAKTYDVEHIYESYEDMLRADTCDVVYIATPHTFHHDHTLLSLRHGKHVLCEKPIAINSVELSDMVSLAREQKLFLMEAIWTEFLPSITQLKYLIEDGVIGDIKMIEANFGFCAPEVLDGRLYNPDLAGGALLDIGIYPVYLAHTLLGAPTTIKSLSSMTETGVDASTTVQMEWADGAMAVLYSTIVAQTDTTAKIYGTDGYLLLHTRWHETKKISYYNAEGFVESWEFPDEYRGYYYEIQEVNKCISEGLIESPSLPLDFSISLMKTMEEIRSQIGLKYPFE